MAIVKGNIHADHDYDDNVIYAEEYQHYVHILLEIKRERIDRTEAKKTTNNVGI